MKQWRAICSWFFGLVHCNAPILSKIFCWCLDISNSPSWGVGFFFLHLYYGLSKTDGCCCCLMCAIWSWFSAKHEHCCKSSSTSLECSNWTFQWITKFVRETRKQLNIDSNLKEIEVSFRLDHVVGRKFELFISNWLKSNVNMYLILLFLWLFIDESFARHHSQDCLNQYTHSVLVSMDHSWIIVWFQSKEDLSGDN